MKSKLAIVAVLAVALGAVLVFKFSGDRAAPALADEINAALASGRPVLFVFTYNGDCCESTKEFFQAYNGMVATMAEEFGSHLSVVWLDTALEDNASVGAMRSLAGRYGVTYLPSLLVVDAHGAGLLVHPGPPDPDALRQVLSQATGGE